MMYKTLAVALLAAAFVFCGNATAQDCGCNTAQSYGADHGQPTTSSCGRGITQQEAASLWAGYCQENCDFSGHRPGLGCRGCGSRHCGGGCGACGSCGTQGCGGCRSKGCGLGCKLRGRFNKMNCGCETITESQPCDTGCESNECGESSCCKSKCGCFAKLKGMFKGGCGRCAATDCGCEPTPCGDECQSGCESQSSCCGLLGKLGCREKSCCGGCKLFGRFHGSRHQCGCNGAYFGESVGYEHGNAGMQSCVSGCSDAAQTSATAEPIADQGEPVVDNLSDN